MRKGILLLFVLFTVNLALGQSEGTDVLVMHHDTTYASSLAKRLADRDTMVNALAALLPSYNISMFDSNTVPSFNAYKSVILQETSFDVANARYLGIAGKDSLRSWLMGGTSSNVRTLVSIGGDQAYNYSRSGSTSRDSILSAVLSGFNYRLDNGNVSGQNSITGVGVDNGNVRTYSTTVAGGGFWPDGAQPLGSSEVLYNYTGRGATDSVAAIAVVDTGYIAITLFLDPRYFTAGEFQEVLLALLDYAVMHGGSFPGLIPVELTSFAATSVGNNVNLSWITATELNNNGFNVERSVNGSDWQNIAFVKGLGTTTETQYYSYTDSKLSNGHYSYRLKQVDFNGTFEYSPSVEVDVNIPVQFGLEQNYPNPFNPATKINFSLAADSRVVVKVFDILGQEVVTLINGNLAAGSHVINFDGAALNSGVYLYKLEATGSDGTNFSSVKKMILNK